MKKIKFGHWRIQMLQTKVDVYHNEQYICSYELTSHKKIKEQLIFQVLIDKRILEKKYRNKTLYLLD